MNALHWAYMLRYPNSMWWKCLGRVRKPGLGGGVSLRGGLQGFKCPYHSQLPVSIL